MPRAIQFDPTASHTTTTATIDTQYTKLWLDGSDLTDKSGTNTLTVTGVTSSTAHSKFGGSSLFFDGSDDKIMFSNTGGSLQLNGAFTVEFWARWDGGSGYNSLVAFGDPSNNYTALLIATYAGSWRIWMANAANNAFNPSAQGFGGAIANTWQHISINCNANASSVECYVDGVRGYSGAPYNLSFGSSDSYSLSGRALGQRYGGYVDDFFVLNGYKLRTGPGSFTVPTTPFSGGLETTTNDTRSFASVFDMRSQYKEQAAGNWPTLPYTSITSTNATELEPGNGYKYFVFTQNGTLVVPSAAANISAEYLVVAGGGGGSGNRGAGAGAGGLRTNVTGDPKAGAAMTLSAATYPVTVGSGGNAGPPGSPYRGTQGGSSSFNSITSAGGGFGSDGDGGSGGGGHSVPFPLGSGAGAGNTPSVSPPQGNDGGTGGPNSVGGWGGGGAGAAGQSGPVGRAGGSGHAIAAFASPLIAPAVPAAAATAIGPTGIYAGGGGGGSGGSGGGAAGSGGGGGGAGNSPGNNPWMQPGGAGGSGIVIVRVPTS